MLKKLNYVSQAQEGCEKISGERMVTHNLGLVSKTYQEDVL